MTITAAETLKWQDFALCAEVGTELFFPEDDKAATPTLYDNARRVCNECPVRELCLSYALEVERGNDRRWRFGFWGGLSPRERAKLDNTAPQDYYEWSGRNFNKRNDESTS